MGTRNTIMVAVECCQNKLNVCLILVYLVGTSYDCFDVVETPGIRYDVLVLICHLIAGYNCSFW